MGGETGELCFPVGDWKLTLRNEEDCHEKRLTSYSSRIVSMLVVHGRREAKDYTILVMPKLVGIPYFNASEAGALQAGEDLGVNVIYAGPNQADAAAQVRMIEDYISRGVDAICVAPNDPAALTPVLRRARDRGILVMDWDTPADPSVVEISVHQIDDKVFGEHTGSR